MDPSIIFAAALLVSDLEDGCGKYDMMQQVLANDYGELPVVHFIDRKRVRLELYVNPSTRTWTVLIVDIRRNKGCIMDSGSHIETMFPGRKQGI